MLSHVPKKVEGLITQIHTDTSSALLRQDRSLSCNQGFNNFNAISGAFVLGRKRCLLSLTGELQDTDDLQAYEEQLTTM